MASLILISYFCGGLAVLCLFDIITKRIRRKLGAAAFSTQLKMIEANLYLGQRTGTAVFLIIMWLFWPAVLIGAVIGRKGGNHGEEESGTDSEDSSGTGGADHGAEVGGKPGDAGDTETCQP